MARQIGISWSARPFHRVVQERPFCQVAKSEGCKRCSAKMVQKRTKCRSTQLRRWRVFKSEKDLRLNTLVKSEKDLRLRKPVKSDKDLRLSTPVKSEKDLRLRKPDGYVGQRTRASCRQLLVEKSEVVKSDTGSGCCGKVATHAAAVRDLAAIQSLRGQRHPWSMTRQLQRRARLVRLTGGLVEVRWSTSIRRQGGLLLVAKKH